MAGTFFSFDGVDGAGKTTQIDLFCDWLREQGHDVVVCRDPGGTPLGEKIRDILLAVDPATPIARTSEMLLYMASRAQLVEQVIAPALAAGKTVVSDRFLLANVVYQGHAGGLDPEQIWQVGQIATGGLAPHLTFLLDLPPEAAAARLDRPLDRMEQQGDDYRRRVREGFLLESERRRQVVVVDAGRSIEDIHAHIRETAERVLASA